MKIENIERAQELIAQRDQLLNVIDKLENEEIRFVNECCDEFETPAECIVEELIKSHKGTLSLTEKELSEL